MAEPQSVEVFGPSTSSELNAYIERMHASIYSFFGTKEVGLAIAEVDINAPLA